jgi:hypothetical protein
MVKKTDKDMTDQELGMMYLLAAHSCRIYIYKWVLSNPSPNNAHLRGLWRVGHMATRSPRVKISAALEAQCLQRDLEGRARRGASYGATHAFVLAETSVIIKAEELARRYNHTKLAPTMSRAPRAPSSMTRLSGGPRAVYPRQHHHSCPSSQHLSVPKEEEEMI